MVTRSAVEHQTNLVKGPTLFDVMLQKFVTPNGVTWFRLISIPFLLFFALMEWQVCAFVLFTFAACSDWVDGFLARRWKQTSAFGENADPIADKLLYAVPPLAFLDLSNTFILVAYATTLVYVVVISSLRGVLMQTDQKVRVSIISKYKTAIVLLGLWLVLMAPLVHGHEPLILEVGELLYIVGALLTCIAGIDYVLTAIPPEVKQQSAVLRFLSRMQRRLP